MQGSLFEGGSAVPNGTKRSRRSRAAADATTVATPIVPPRLLNRVHARDCLAGMRELPDQSVDVAIADPPYNASKGGQWAWDNSVDLPGFGGNWSKVMAHWDNISLTEYLGFTIAWLSELRRVVRPTGSLWIHGTYHNIGIINFALQALEIEIINEIVWFKRNSFPNLSGRRLTASHETILWAHTGKRRAYRFNYEDSKLMRCPEDQLKQPGKQMRTVWDIPNNKERSELSHGKHPTQKPLRLLDRMLALSAVPGNVCLVPFAGVGSECVAAHRRGLHFVGFETDTTFAQVAEQRLKEQAAPSLVPPPGLRPNPPGCPLPPVSSRPALPGRAVVPSLIKWTGSKRSQADEISSMFPSSRARYIEPFLGSGAMLFVGAHPGALAGDIYSPLIQLWKIVQAEPDRVVADYSRKWAALQERLPSYFYEVRDRFNQEGDPLDLNFLMRTCVNGIVRFNDEGHFNNSFHLSRKGMEPSRFGSVVAQWSKRLKGVQFVAQDYEATLDDAREGDFAYLDPPYAGTKQRYAADFCPGRLWEVLERLNSRGVRWALSFDGSRGQKVYLQELPRELYVRHVSIASGHSPVGRVLNGPIEMVHESLYLNY